MEFEKRKAATLASLVSTESDKSPKGSLDAPIVPLLNALNQNPSYFTTSSCSGRISILSQPISEVPNPKKKARGGTWLFVSHDPADPDSVLSLLFPSEPTRSPFVSELVFRFEPLIIALECRDLSAAHSLVSLAISCGFRESGITNAKKRVIIAIRCSIRMEVPLGDTRTVMVTPEYVRYLVQVANEKMEANRKRTQRFFQVMQSTGSLIADNGDRLLSTNEACNHLQLEDESQLGNGNAETSEGSVSSPGSGLSISHFDIVGEPAGMLFLWGHSACGLNKAGDKKLIIFGGFGGLGRHARRNDLLLLDPYSGNLEILSTVGCASPTPRLGHTASMVGNSMFVIGGRTGPDKILSDVWILDTTMNSWKLLQCTENLFPPRHRHAAAIMGSNIYVFGGLDNDTIFSSFYVFDTKTLHWKEIPVSGDWPCARHSHAMVASDSQIFMFGGYNGGKALGDLYSFDVQKGQWTKERTTGRNPHARFSHSIFVHKNYLGVLGGCPVRQHFEELALLDLKLRLWKHVTINSVGKDLFVRSTINVVGDDLVIVGGGASCYAFGTKFSEPAKVNLLHIIHSRDGHMSVKNKKCVINQDEGTNVNNIESSCQPQLELGPNVFEDESLCSNDNLPCLNDQSHMIALHYILQLKKEYAKLGKDILKKFGWLDLGRKARTEEGGVHICFPVHQDFFALFHERNHHLVDASDGKNEAPFLDPRNQHKYLLNELSYSEALTILHEYGAILLEDKVVEERKAAKSPLKMMTEAVTSLIEHKGLPVWLLEELPTRWDRLGDIIILPINSFKDSLWDSIAGELWPIVAKSLKAHRLARQGPVAATGTRDSTLQILVGDGGWVNHRENGVLYSFDATKCMFSWGNLSEKIRMASLDCREEVVVDLFAGIGYFVLPFLVRATAKFVYACEWNPHAVEALRHNLQANSVADRCIILEGDNRITAPRSVADRVCLGLIPSSELSWVTAVRALRREGGVLHVHGNTKDSEESQWIDHVAKSINDIARSEGYCWEISIEHVERVKWYAPHIRHVVVDVRCRQIQR
ncbi:tRNA wybutosine-synthesizing protein 2/3/4 [Vigna unguiculata]|uniref:tRNA wybutosine-synthesizing protein 2/3/4 n=1 Tax=Vigna unguiculata TaxID=3917 RepID=UPI001015FC4D|nr:tRNA wybutosine-synthesizing protein 2/3/4 [Vigna unguiculata]